MKRKSVAGSLKRSSKTPVSIGFGTQVLPLLSLLMLPVVVEAQYSYTTNSGAITITGYTGPGGAVAIPSAINGRKVIRIADFAFDGCTNLTSVMIPNSVTSIGNWAFYFCTSLNSITLPNTVTNIGSAAFYACGRLTSVTIPNSLTSIGPTMFQNCISLTNVSIPNSVRTIGIYAFVDCASLTSVTIPNSVTSIGDWAFHYCTNLTSVTIGSGLTTIGAWAFYACTSLTGVFFNGNAPTVVSSVFDGDNSATVYYLPGRSGWGQTFGGRPTSLWKPQVQTSDPTFGVRTNQFGFNIIWASGAVVVIEACTNLVNVIWVPVGTNTLTGGSSYFSDADWPNYPRRFYRIRSR